MELGHLLSSGRFGPIYLHVLIQSIIHDQRMCHTNSMWLHRMCRSIRVITNVTVVEIGNTLLILWVHGDFAKWLVLVKHSVVCVVCLLCVVVGLYAWSVYSPQKEEQENGKEEGERRKENENENETDPRPNRAPTPHNQHFHQHAQRTTHLLIHLLTIHGSIPHSHVQRALALQQRPRRQHTRGMQHQLSVMQCLSGLHKIMGKPTSSKKDP